MVARLQKRRFIQLCRKPLRRCLDSSLSCARGRCGWNSRLMSVIGRAINTLDEALPGTFLRGMAQLFPICSIRSPRKAVWTIQSLSEAMRLVQAVRPGSWCQFSLAEMTSEGCTSQIESFYRCAMRVKSRVQHILYSPIDLVQVDKAMFSRKKFRSEAANAFVLGRYGPRRSSET